VEAGLLAGSRLLQYSGCFVLFGGSVFHLMTVGVSVSGHTPAYLRRQRALLLFAAAVALLGAVVWMMAETASMMEDPGAAFAPTALITVATETRFGLACSVRVLLLVVSLAAGLAIKQPRPQWISQTALGAAITITFAWTGHGAMEIAKTNGIHLAADLIHLLAAGVWIGALVPLTMRAQQARRTPTVTDLQSLYFALNSFSAIGIWVVGALVLTGIVNGRFLLGPSPWSALLASPYGLVLLAKLGLFLVMLCIAALNRYRLAPGLGDTLTTHRSPKEPVKVLRRALFIETIVALWVLLAVSVLGMLPPPAA
jgi:putative copper resistance protein D